MEIHSEPEVQAMLRQGATLVTVNRRLSRYAMERYAKEQVRLGHAAWETPDIIPYAAWLERCLDERPMSTGPAAAKQGPMLLRPLQERLLWVKVIESSSFHKILMRSAEAARMSEQAWRLCIEWRIPIDSGPDWMSADPGAFAQWAGEFERRCLRKNWLARPLFADAVIDALSHGCLSMPGVIIFSGFDDFSPQTKDLVNALAAFKIKTCVQAFPVRSGKAVRTGCSDEVVEIEAAAKWARQRRERNAEERIGVIIRGLEQNRDTICRIFDETFHPSSMVSMAPVDVPAYNISLGRPLSNYLLVKNALVILDMVNDNPSIETIHSLLLSPFIKGAQTETTRRARADAILRESKQHRMPVVQIYRSMKNEKHGKSQKTCPVFLRSLEAFERICLDIPDIQSPTAWCTTFSALLDAFGWPGDQPLDSGEYQVAEAWNDALARFSGAGEVFPEINFIEACRIFRRLLDETPFQPETGNVDLQIMGVLEAAGEQFDALWITGLTSESWPSAPTPNPLIPMPLQIRHDLPRATAERELAFSRQVMQRLISCADEVIISFPMMFGESPLYPSALIEGLPEVAVEPMVENNPGYRQLLAASGVLEACADTDGPPLKYGETITGGTGIMKNQSGCPFSAFARYRLRAKPLEFPVSGLDAADRGSLVHSVLERVWDTLENHKALISKPREELSAIVSDAVSEAVSTMANTRTQTFTARFAGMEKKRLHDLVMEWLENDAARMPYEVIDKERSMRVAIGAVQLNTCADRIDRLQDGSLVVIDYKTGNVSVKDWFADRIAEPQLPLYCIDLEDVPTGVFFARVKKGDMKYVGIADDQSIVKGIKSVADTGGLNEVFGGIEDIVAHWRMQLEELADELVRGHAVVSPVSVNKTCRFCHFKCFCRVNELVEMGLISAQG